MQNDPESVPSATAPTFEEWWILQPPLLEFAAELKRQLEERT